MQGVQALLKAIERGDEDGAIDIVARDAAVARENGPKGESPLLAAVYRGQTRLAKAIARVRTLTITEAAALGDGKMVGDLVKRDRKALNSYSLDGWTPLHLAAFFGHAAVARALLDAGADLEAYSENSTHNRPLHAALAGKGDSATVILLLERNANVDARGATGITPLHLAASRGATDFTEILLGRGADRTARTDDGKTPADLATASGHTASAALLTRSAGEV